MVVLGWWMVRCSGRARRMRKRAAVDGEEEEAKNPTSSAIAARFRNTRTGHHHRAADKWLLKARRLFADGWDLCCCKIKRVGGWRRVNKKHRECS